MHFLRTIPLVACLAGASSIAMAASNTDLTVKGSITPSACAPLISGGGMIDFGKLAVKDLNAEQYTSLPNQSIQLSVRCEAPTFFTLTTIDNRAGSSANHDFWHGLGITPEGEKLGGTAFHLYAPVADGVAVRTITSQDGGVIGGGACAVVDGGQGEKRRCFTAHAQLYGLVGQ